MPAALLHPFAKPTRESFLRIVRGEGALLWNAEGRELVDGMASLWYCAIGHGRAEMAEAIATQVRTLEAYSTFDPFTNDPAEELAEELRTLGPIPGARVFFTCSGSESVDSAMKMALAYHRIRGQGHRQLFVSRERAYHGVNLGGVALSGMVNNRRTFGVGLPGVHFMRHTALPENRFVRGQPESGADLAEDLARICAMVGGDNVAAVFVEPTAGSCAAGPRGTTYS